ncbi:hypothetical protein DFQ27_007456 [Actinomortierella ambigua]|uniref:Triacylglycerol lipase n=1 Tax=Actinomortierella ambigua TaxID=1343610 RepID=A0A9P6UBV2_9FUNG|nr:hypothetical protein DFQ27_007456 [Actinomortierella ambigua]
MGPRLASEGYCVYSLTYGKVFDEAPIGGVTSMEDSSKELAVFVDKVLNSTGASKVNLLGHCEGSIMPRYYLKFLGGAAKVDKYAALAPVGSGTTMSGIVILAKAFNIYDAVHNTVYPGCSSCTEILINSTFIQNLNADGETVPGVKYLFVATKYDLVITPPSNGFLHDNSPNVINHWLQDWCSVAVNGHSDITLSPVAFAGVNAFFDSHAPQSISCTS